MKSKKILVPLDGSKNSMRGLNKAINLAKDSEAEIIGLFIIKTNPTELGVIKSLIEKAFKKKSKDFLKIAKKKCIDKKIPFLDVVDFGQIGPKIIEHSIKNKCNTIVMGARGMGPVKEAFLGSTSNYVIQKSKIPVLVVK